MLPDVVRPDSSPMYEQPIPEVLGSNLCLLKSVRAVGWQPTGFENENVGI